MSRIVIALGGNALGNNPDEQKQLIKIATKKIVELVNGQNEVVIGHGNGPQVGMIFNTFLNCSEKNKFIMPFPEAGAMSQGYIGYHILTSLKNELVNQNKNNVNPLYFLTQTIVNKNDSSFNNPTKPVGPFYSTLDEAKSANPNSVVKEDSNRGYRKVVASPLPIDFLGFDAIKQSISKNNVIVVSGGGGIPTVVDNDGQYYGVDGVIDKDFALSKFASKIQADMFIILTAVSKVCIDFGQPSQKELANISINEASQYIAQKQFGEGSMLPKVQAAIEFVKNNPNGKAIIAKLEELEDAINGRNGTIISAN